MLLPVNEDWMVLNPPLASPPTTFFIVHQIGLDKIGRVCSIELFKLKVNLRLILSLSCKIEK